MKKIVSLITIVMVIIASASCVKAVEESKFTFSATPDKTQVKPGESITISLKVSDIQLGENGMNTLEGILKFDASIFEAITEDSASGQNNWSASMNTEVGNANYGKFLFNKTSAGIKTEQVIGSITLKVKADVAESTPTIITISNIVSNNGTDLISVQDKVINLNVQAEEENPNPNPTPDPDANKTPDTNEVGELNVVSNEVDGNKVTNKVDNTISKDKIPQTGENIMIGTSILVVGALAIYFYIRAYKMR